MTKLDFERMSREELKTYLVSHRQDDEAWAFFFEKLNRLDRSQCYPADLPATEVERLIRERIDTLEQSG